MGGPLRAALRAVVVATVASSCHCGEPSGAAPDAAAQPPPVHQPSTPDTRVLLQDADTRRLTPALREAVGSPSVEVRRVAALAIARLHDPAAEELLRQALRDPDPRVRSNASLGLGGLEDEATEDAAKAVLGALGAEDDRPTRADMLWDLGRLGGEEAMDAFQAALAEPEEAIRAAACRGLGSYGLRRVSVPAAMHRRIAVRMVDDPDAGVRLACAYALTRLPAAPPDVHDAVARDLIRAAGDADAEVRIMAVRALAKYGPAGAEVLEARTADPDWRVAVQAFRALAGLADDDDAAFARALRARLDLALQGPLHGPSLHVLLTALTAAQPLAARSSTAGVALEALDRLGRPEPYTPDRDRGLAHCAAAELVDRARGLPDKLGDCGFGLVSEAERHAQMAAVLGAASGADRQRATSLKGLYADTTPLVREAVLSALPSVAPPYDAGLLETILQALASNDPGVITAASDALVELAPRWRRPEGAEEDQPLSPMLRAQLFAPLSAAYQALSPGEVEGLQSWLKVVAALGLTELAEPIQALARHPNRTVRHQAREAADSLGLEVPAGDPEPVGNPLPATSFPAPGTDARAVLETDRGEITIELLSDDAPSTVTRFEQLASDGFFDGLTFHRVVPAFVVQGGDPRGDGYGGPGWTQRCEDNRVRYERGTVGMALAGRDTGGSQFFIAHNAQPHLDGRYTAFGRVVEGMDVVDQLQQGDTIRHVRIER